jgi:hypothetical protein
MVGTSIGSPSWYLNLNLNPFGVKSAFFPAFYSTAITVVRRAVVPPCAAVTVIS